MFRRRCAFLLQSSTVNAPCVLALSADLHNVSFWNEYAIKNKVPVVPAPGSSLGHQQHVIFASAATAALQCLASEHAADIETAIAAVKRWSDLDVDDEITKLLAYNRDARENLAQAIITHQQNTEFVVYACRAITNLALLPSPSSSSSSSSPASGDASSNDSNTDNDHLTHLAQTGILPVLIEVCSREAIFDVVQPSGRGVAWVLQAIQNLILKSDVAAEKCANFGSEQRHRVNPDTLSNAEHDEMSQETTAEHHISIAVSRVLERHTASWHSLINEEEDDQEIAFLKKRIAIVAVDSGLACMARLLSMSADRNDNNTTVNHRSEYASPSVFRAVVNALANTQITPSSSAIQHKTWECLRQLVSTRDNIAPLLAALHAADGMSGMSLLSKWLEATKDELPPTLFGPDHNSNNNYNSNNNNNINGVTEDEDAATLRHEVLQRTVCGLDVMIELTAASTNASTVSNLEKENTNESSSSEIEQPEPQFDEDGNQIFATSSSADDAHTQRWDSAMQSITSGTLSKFCVSILTSLHEKLKHGDECKNLSAATIGFVDEIRIKSLTLLLHLSQNDPYVRNANCLVVLQRGMLKPYINQLMQRQLSNSNNSNNNDSSCSKNESATDAQFVIALQKTMSILWNCLNFSDSAKSMAELRLQSDIELIVKHCCGSSSTQAPQQQQQPTPEEENLKAAGEKLLEKMKILLQEKKTTQSA